MISTLIEQLYFCRMVCAVKQRAYKSGMFDRSVIFSIIGLSILSACTTQKQSSSTIDRNNPPPASVVNKNPKFLDDISVSPGSTGGVVYSEKNKRESKKRNTNSSNVTAADRSSSLQVRYAALLNTDADQVRDLKVYQYIDEWYGTRYCMGGNTKTCTDCSGFVQNFFFAMYGVKLPTSSKELYGFSTRISTTKLRQGDLLFYNTRGGVSHVGIYLQNNKFVHASTTGGVMISDMAEPYYSKRFIGARRVSMETEMPGK